MNLPFNPLNLLGLSNPLIGLLFSFNAYLFLIVFALWIRKKIKLIGAIRTLVFWNDGTQDITNYKIKDAQLQIRPSTLIGGDKKAWTPRVISQNIIPPKLNFLRKYNPFGFKQRDLLIAVEGSPECVSIKGALKRKDLVDELQSKLLKTWTPLEVTSMIRKAIAKATVSRKVFNDSQFYFFMLIIMLNLMMSIMIARRMGLF